MEGGRPNIRIEIQNSVTEAMEVDNEEEGEITEETDTAPQFPENSTVTSADIFSSETDSQFSQEKLHERAKRFGLSVDKNQIFTRKEMEALYISLGVSDSNNQNIRAEAIFMLGTDKMKAEDIFQYFLEYKPSCIEWIDQNCCNVVWEDKLLAAKALYFSSKPIKGMPVKDSSDNFMKEIDTMMIEIDKEDTNGGSFLTQNREIELEKDDFIKSSDYVDLKNIKSEIPPGYWRLGKEHFKSNEILLRFSKVTDKQPFKIEKFDELRRILQGNNEIKRPKSIFDSNKDIVGQDSKNPWGNLAKNWEEDTIFCEKDYKVPNPDSKKIPSNKNSIMNRLGFKRAHGNNVNDQQEQKVEDNIKNVEPNKKKIKIPRMRMYADEEEEKLKYRKKIQQRTDKKQEKDLRSYLESGRNVAVENYVPTIDITDDLGDKLKNRRLLKEEKVTRALIPITGSLRSDEILEKRKERRKMKELSPPLVRERSRERRSKRHSRTRHTAHRRPSEAIDSTRTQSKVAVVVKRQKKPAVASTVWARINNARESRHRSGTFKRTSSSNSGSSSDSNSSSTHSTSNKSSSSESESEDDAEPETTLSQRFKQIKAEVHHRPGFTHIADPHSNKSPLRIEIKNDRFRRK